MQRATGRPTLGRAERRKGSWDAHCWDVHEPKIEDVERFAEDDDGP
jgi:hypothetical protein